MPLTARKRMLVVCGVAMFFAQLVAAALLAAPTTGQEDASGVVLWLGSLAWSVATVLLVVRQADRADIATAAFIVTIAPFALFVFAAAYDTRGTSHETNLVDALFFGVTTGALTALPVWGIAASVARVLRLPTTEALRGGD